MARKIFVDEFDVCHKFVHDLERHCRYIDCAITHNVPYEDFVIFFDYDDSSADSAYKKSIC